MKIKIDFKKIKKVSSFFAKYRYLLFTVFFCSSLVYSFQVIYDHTYSNLNYINYTDDVDLIMEGKGINRRMETIIDNIENRNDEFNIQSDFKYVDPFRYNIKKVEVKDTVYENNNNSVEVENIEINEDL
ncbi:MAG: hypothetical protein KAI67_02890 [Candidatus Pacebacteria bacterium]|nr:hypothetical protein [Candidatus Paceibacterota bacterium]